eukprot:TRINITY_DN394_c0_g1_i1.p1 TRINITY_DN394_c0_g1~~TRINITY_DN394_c0_g1_i1.p1  ORF type:complete len:1097 (-),score=271.50 TRINITY_DN394_c0_g1_i1:216-3506(-)
MGAEASRADAAEQKTPAEFVGELEKACRANHGKGDLEEFKARWLEMHAFRTDKEHGVKNDDKLVTEFSVLKWVKYAFRHRESAWRELGITIAHSFFHLEGAREKLRKADFTGSLLLITLPDEKAEDNEDEDKGGAARDEKAHEERQVALQLQAANVVRDMADFKEFIPSLCSTSVLNFLCTVLNQVPAAVEAVTHTLVKLSAFEDNLVLLMEGAVGDILESFFKTVNFKRPSGDDEARFVQWTLEINALSYTAHTLGTFIKYNHQCQVDLPTIVDVLNEFLENLREDEDVPDNVALLSEMLRLFYWVCRRSTDITKLMIEASDGAENIDNFLKTLVEVWQRCVKTCEIVQAGEEAQAIAAQGLGGQGLPGQAQYPEEFLAFMTDNIIITDKLKEDSPEWKAKIKHTRQRLCYMNCMLWVLLPVHTIRWKLRSYELTQLFLAFELKAEFEILRVMLSTVRHLLDLPYAQDCSQLIRFFGEQLLALIDKALKPDGDPDKIPPSVTRLLLDAICILAMQREMQVLLAEEQYDIWTKLRLLVKETKKNSKDQEEVHKIGLATTRILAHVAMHPAHRLQWVAKHDKSMVPWTLKSLDVYPPREPFVQDLEARIRDSDENFKTLASLLLTIFQEEKFERPVKNIEQTLKSILEWWKVNSTTRYEEEKEAREAEESGKQVKAGGGDEQALTEMLKRGLAQREQQRVLTVMEAMPFCAPHESVLALTLFSRLALEPRFKTFFVNNALHALLSCLCVSVWPEAREAAACLANLMWMPDVKEERLVCWLKMDGPKCIAVDAANVVLPVKIGNPRPADIGKGMYRSSWGVEFVEGSVVMLHTDGLSTHAVPGTLTSASPSDTFENTSKGPYLWLDEGPPHPKHFTLCCWFYWPLSSIKSRKVLVKAKDSASQIYYEDSVDNEAGWEIVDENSVRQPLRTPRLNPGWHMLTVISSTSESATNSFDGTKFFLDDWHCTLKNVWMKNEFYMVGNDSTGKRPFGLITDFRIYARALPTAEVEALVRQRDTEAHPDQIARRLADMDAATLLALRLDVPDAAAECLRALASLSTLQSQRAKIFSVCGRRVLRMLDSPLPSIQRQAARLLTNIT